MTEDSDPYCLSSASAAGLLADAPWRRFASFGDSLAAGTSGPSAGYASLGWPERLADVLRRVYPDLAFLNAGKIGATTGETLERFGRIVEFTPDLLHISCGANDIWRSEPSFALLASNLREIFTRAAATGARLTTFTLGKAFVVPGIPDWTARVQALNDIIRSTAAEHHAVVVDMWSHSINSRPDLLSADGIHFSASGQAVMASELVKALARLVAVRA